ncbi:MAG: lactate racemase domain-containing protein [Chloroflexota bacterium]|jgi:hypothetical protein|nr:lactate racemase domain-containing protein [Chloroflexota bacterium]MDP6509412.1 lactate racemase domain-containing protein [Chloroflexota bacterium]MDP6757479.1 lactate racemase domain-containing protein [Chloroflexota bacterium]
MQDLPLFVPMRQQFDETSIDDLEAAISAGIRARLVDATFTAGQSVAVGVGSRGVSPIQQVVRTVIAELRAAGLEPFIVPAMGSHGGGTAEGQRDVLLDYGITPEGVGAEIRATMDTVVLGHTPDKVEIHCDANAHAADHIVVIGRVKPHTGFRSDIESGLCKIMAVGLGKCTGAERIHEGGLTRIPEAATVFLNTGKILFGLGLVENAFDVPAFARVAAPDEFHAIDRELLVEAKRLIPSIPTDQLHLLVIDEMGKNISGSGMDTNVIGKWRRAGGEKIPYYEFISILRLTAVSHGNATGIGSADFTTKKLADSVDWHDTYINAQTAMVPDAVKCPMTFATDRECLEMSAHIASRKARGADPRIVRIKSTLEIETFLATEAVAAEMEAADRASRTGAAIEFQFDAAGELVDFAG